MAMVKLDKDTFVSMVLRDIEDRRDKMERLKLEDDERWKYFQLTEMTDEELGLDKVDEYLKEYLDTKVNKVEDLKKVTYKEPELKEIELKDGNMQLSLVG